MKVVPCILSFVLVVVAGVALSLCCHQRASAYKPSPATSVLKNVVYNEEFRRYCVGDIYKPAVSANALLPAVIVVHGGAFMNGSKDALETHPVVNRLVREGFAVFDINYRLEKQGGAFPNNANDVKSAVRFLSRSAGRYRVDSHRIATLGISAGGELALLAAYDPQIAYKYVSLAVAVAPATDLEVLDNPVVAALFPKKNVSRRLKASPVTYAESAVPTLLVHGTADSVVPLEQSELLADSLKKAHVPVELERIQGANHGFILEPGQAQEQALSYIVRFLKDRL